MPPRKPTVDARSNRKALSAVAPDLAAPDGRPRLCDAARYVAPVLWDDNSPPTWPPDAFAITASLLNESGAYRLLVKRWPPKTTLRCGEWAKAIKIIGREWRGNFIRNVAAPSEIVKWWDVVKHAADTVIVDIQSDESLCEALLQLCAAADEASEGLGVPSGEPGDDFDKFAQTRLRVKSTLCTDAVRATFKVLPKLHTPQAGITIRSLTHHLALCNVGEIEVHWAQGLAGPDRLSMNLLLVPIPYDVQPSQFTSAAPRTGALTNMPDCYGFFDYRVSGLDAPGKVVGLLDKAKALVGNIDGVVFPELALRESDERTIRALLESQNIFLVCGVGEGSTGASPGKNYVVFNLPISPFHTRRFIQSKHHRWLLDKRQVIQYGLGGTLNTTCGWWEHAEITKRELHFVPMTPWLTVCVLICEDLARPDPAAEIVRAIGPNLVIAVLMDGPQLKARWSARYATVLADDPGCSVLTLTSAGMARLSRPDHKVSPGPPVVGLWKDAKSGGPMEIELPNGAEALVLSMSVEYHEEWTADGRGDDVASGYPVLVGIHPVWTSSAV